MFAIVDARQAVGHIRDGDCIGINAFLALCNPEALHRALFERVRETGHPPRAARPHVVIRGQYIY